MEVFIFVIYYENLCGKIKLWSRKENYFNKMDCLIKKYRIFLNRISCLSGMFRYLY